MDQVNGMVKVMHFHSLSTMITKWFLMMGCGKLSKISQTTDSIKKKIGPFKITTILGLIPEKIINLDEKFN